MKFICKMEDDNGVICNNEIDKYQYEQDGMCSRCADLFWTDFVLPIWKNGEVKPIVFKKE